MTNWKKEQKEARARIATKVAKSGFCFTHNSFDCNHEAMKADGRLMSEQGAKNVNAALATPEFAPADDGLGDAGE